MGWYMVKSGLENKFEGPSDVPRVSQYRLAAHLSLAFVLYTLLLWSALDHLLPAERLTEVTRATSRFRALAHSCKGLVFLTAVSGESKRYCLMAACRLKWFILKNIKQVKYKIWKKDTDLYVWNITIVSLNKYLQLINTYYVYGVQICLFTKHFLNYMW